MAQYKSPSDTTTINPNYSIGNGYYTTSAKVSELLQIPDFSATTTPMHSEVGEFIKRIEDFIDTARNTLLFLESRSQILIRLLHPNKVLMKHGNVRVQLTKLVDTANFYSKLKFCLT